MRKRRPGTVLLISLTLLSVAGTLVTMPQSALAQGQSLSGWLHVIWADPFADANGEPGPRYVLIDDQGQWTEVKLDEDRLRPLDGPLAFDRQRVTVAGEWEEEQPSGQGGGFAHRRRLRIDGIQVEPYAGAPATSLTATPRAVTGSQPWVTILCRFADSATVTPRPTSYFDGLLAGMYPGLDHYWREVSYDNINIAGSVVVGWYNLPQPFSYYVYDQNGDGVADLDFQRAANDCTAAADPDVFFPNFAGINLMFNQSLGCCAWGGSTTLTLDGQQRSYGIAWDPPWAYANQDVVGHEMGHGFGLRHSSGPYNTPYDSQWDVMSAGGRCSPRDATYGCIAVHTISYHKDFLGWIPAARKFVPAPGSSQTIVLERLAQPMSSSNYLMAQIPIGKSTTQFYTVEARRFAGYDNQIPGEAIVIHKVDTTRSDRLAQVVDSDNNGNPNDAGARWTPGETFTDSANGIAVTVNAATTAGFSVTVGYIGAGPAAALVSSVLPTGRSVQVSNTATTFATILNTGTATALSCSISPVTSLPALFSFQATNCATNLPSGSLSTPVDILAGTPQCFVLSFTPSSPIAPTDVAMNFDCTNTNPAPIIAGVNTLLLSASSTPVPDIIALAATCLSNDSIPAVNIPGASGTGAFSVATANVGAESSITVTADTGSVSLPVNLSVCQTDPGTGACLATSTSSVTTVIGAGASSTFGVFVQGARTTIPFDPATNRVFVRFKDAGAVTRGATSVAVRTHSPACVP